MSKKLIFEKFINENYPEGFEEFLKLMDDSQGDMPRTCFNNYKRLKKERKRNFNLYKKLLKKYYFDNLNPGNWVLKFFSFHCNKLPYDSTFYYDLNSKWKEEIDFYYKSNIIPYENNNFMDEKIVDEFSMKML